MVANKIFGSAGTGSETTLLPRGKASGSLPSPGYLWLQPPPSSRGAVPGQGTLLESWRWLHDPPRPRISANVGVWGFFPSFLKVQTTILSCNATASCNGWQSGSTPPRGTGLWLPPRIIREVGTASQQPPRELRHPAFACAWDFYFCSLTLQEVHNIPPSLALHLTIAHTAAKIFQCFPNPYVMCTQSTFGDPGHQPFPLHFNVLSRNRIYSVLLAFCADKCSHDQPVNNCHHVTLSLLKGSTAV